jgi:hypothetical protein
MARVSTAAQRIGFTALMMDRGTTARSAVKSAHYFVGLRAPACDVPFGTPRPSSSPASYCTRFDAFLEGTTLEGMENRRASSVSPASQSSSVSPTSHVGVPRA